MWPGIFCCTLLWIAASAGGTVSGAAGIWLAMPDTVEIVTVSPLATVSSGFSRPSKKPQCSVSGAASSRWCAMCSPDARALPFLKNEKRASANERETDQMIPADRLLQIDQREAREEEQRDHLLHRLELRRRIDRVAVAVRRHREAVFDERDGPACQDHAPQRHVL